jgi:hypothetical protein
VPTAPTSPQRSNNFAAATSNREQLGQVARELMTLQAVVRAAPRAAQEASLSQRLAEVRFEARGGAAGSPKCGPDPADCD